MCPWEWARQERETFFDSFRCIWTELWDLLIHAFPYGFVDLGVDWRMRHWKKERNKGVPYVCLFLFISSKPNRSTSSAAWLKPMLEKTDVVHLQNSTSQTRLSSEILTLPWNEIYEIYRYVMLSCISKMSCPCNTKRATRQTTWLPFILEVCSADGRN